MCRKSIGFWKSMLGGIMRRVMKSQAAHMFAQSCSAGTPKGEEEYPCLGTSAVVAGRMEALGAERRGNMKGGRSRSQSEYWPAVSVQRWIGRSADSVKSVCTSASEYYEDASESGG